MHKKMKILSTLLFLLAVLTLKATEQRPDFLIYKLDTIYIDKFPLDILAENDSEIAKKLIDSACIASDCWRQYIATWKIENDSIFLIELKNCCNHKIIPLKNVFGKDYPNSEKVFASWYTDNIIAGFGEKLGFIEEKLGFKYEKYIELIIDKGKVIKLSIMIDKK